MQIIQLPGNAFLAGTSAISQTIQLVSAAANVRGVIVRQVSYRSYMTAVSASLTLNISCGGLFAYPLQDSNGGAGSINVPVPYLSDKEVQFPAGSAVNLNFTQLNNFANYAVTLTVL